MKPMIDIRVDLENPYHIYIRQVLLKDAGQYIEKFYKKIVIITDDIVDGFYADTVFRAFKREGNEIYKYIVPHGEENKNLKTAEGILNFLSEVNVKKDDLLIALGGGVIGDLTGFAASVFLRGMDFIQIPTTFLSAIDASVGGKTGVNLPEGKNLVGTFKQPEVVICDTDCFKTLDDLTFSEGVAEALKVAVLFDRELYWRFSEGVVRKDSYDIDQIIKSCIEYKKALVEEDEFDGGKRKMLNFGHTVGHAVEKRSGYNIRHGQAVAIGMAVMIRGLERSNHLEPGVSSALEHTLTKYNLPIFIEYDFDEILPYLERDKKIRNGKIEGPVIDAIGRSRLAEQDLDDFIELCRLGWDPE